MSAPVSEQNAPVDKRPGFKSWSPGVERWWQGSQWSETYRAVERKPGQHAWDAGATRCFCGHLTANHHSETDESKFGGWFGPVGYDYDTPIWIVCDVPGCD